jgi:hypothetical protein
MKYLILYENNQKITQNNQKKPFFVVFFIQMFLND